MFIVGSFYFKQCLSVEHMVDRIYAAELQLNKPNSSDTEAPFLDLNLFFNWLSVFVGLAKTTHICFSKVINLIFAYFTVMHILS